MRVLLSVKPDFADRIFDGSKIYEFRKVIFKKPNIKTVVVYASSPVQRIIGEFDIEDILKYSPIVLWRKTHAHAGISEEFFFNYFAKREIAFAIKIKKVRPYKKHRRLSTSYNILPPQSFCYV